MDFNTEGFLLLISAFLFCVEIVESIWAFSLFQSMRGHPGSRFAPIMASTIIGITIAQGALFAAILALNVSPDDTYPVRLGLIIASQLITVATMMWAIFSIKKI